MLEYRWRIFVMYRISNDEFDIAYKIMEQAFPLSELRTYAKMKEYFDDNKLILYGLKDNEVLTGVIMCWECNSCLFLENFAVNEEARGKGIGSKILQTIQARYDHHLIVLEAEQPHDEISERRIAFYERNGFILSDYGYMQPQINCEINEIPLLLMSYPKKINQETFISIRNDLFKNVYMK
ncbi:MAG: GNAT family N-acetyltransferase [Erysipelotrichia bacterium]|nr:GNAT family N-acetyltransferase [Erysipelotrichia bacterium]